MCVSSLTKQDLALHIEFVLQIFLTPYIFLADEYFFSCMPSYICKFHEQHSRLKCASMLRTFGIGLPVPGHQ
jgi:hypothetical protein